MLAISIKGNSPEEIKAALQERIGRRLGCSDGRFLNLR